MSLPNNYHATRNQVSVVNNPHQGKATKVLTVCSAGVLRSPTLANVLTKNFNYNCRAVGSLHQFALIPISEALIEWADEIVFVDDESYDMLDREIKEDISNALAIVITLDIPDNYDYGSTELEEILLEEYCKS